MEVDEKLATVKKLYIDNYFNEHNKHRLDVRGGKQKSNLISSLKYANLKWLSEIEMLTHSKQRLTKL
jgi:hypothetical protein